MSEPQFKTHREVIKALAEGKKITRKDWSQEDYIEMDDRGLIFDRSGNETGIDLHMPSTFSIWTPPKKKVRKEVKMWVNIYKNTTRFHSNKNQALKSRSKRCIATVELVGHYEVEEEA